MKCKTEGGGHGSFSLGCSSSESDSSWLDEDTFPSAPKVVLKRKKEQRLMKTNPLTTVKHAVGSVLF